MNCSFYSFEYLSASGYERRFDSGEGVCVEHIPDIHEKKHPRDFVKITVVPGSLFFIFIEEASEENCTSVLVKVPDDLGEYKLFCDKALLYSGQEQYEKNKLGFGTMDWLNDYIVQKWVDNWTDSENCRPYSIESALTLLRESK